MNAILLRMQCACSYKHLVSTKERDHKKSKVDTRRPRLGFALAGLMIQYSILRDHSQNFVCPVSGCFSWKKGWGMCDRYCRGPWCAIGSTQKSEGMVALVQCCATGGSGTGRRSTGATTRHITTSTLLAVADIGITIGRRRHKEMSPSHCTDCRRHVPAARRPFPLAGIQIQTENSIYMLLEIPDADSGHDCAVYGQTAICDRKVHHNDLIR
nr:hypothetical protein CFP56_31500 [Quercus suber]